jgi:hypothetical protein
MRFTLSDQVVALQDDLRPEACNITRCEFDSQWVEKSIIIKRSARLDSQAKLKFQLILSATKRVFNLKISDQEKHKAQQRKRNRRGSKISITKTYVEELGREILLGEVVEVLDEPIGSPHAKNSVLRVPTQGLSIIFIEDEQAVEKVLFEKSLNIKSTQINTNPKDQTVSLVHKVNSHCFADHFEINIFNRLKLI